MGVIDIMGRTGGCCQQDQMMQRLTSCSSHTASRPSFYEVALSYGTDKVTTHHYHHMYQVRHRTIVVVCVAKN